MAELCWRSPHVGHLALSWDQWLDLDLSEVRRLLEWATARRRAEIPKRPPKR